MKTLFRLLMVFLLTAQVALAQRTISGVVSDSDGIPLPGATVLIQGTSTGVTTDFDGNFSISADNGDVLVVSFVGYENSLVTVGSGSTYNFSLQSDNELEEVVVTALGLEVKKDEDVSSATLIKSEVIQRSGESGLIQGLAGKTSGVIVTSNTGDPGAGGYVQIRVNVVFVQLLGFFWESTFCAGACQHGLFVRQRLVSPCESLCRCVNDLGMILRFALSG
jgi:hypothetical protein